MRRLAITLCAALAAAPAGAAVSHWRSVKGADSLAWTAHWQGTPVKGQFPDFSVSGAFDPRSPAGGTIEVTIDTSTIETASADVTRAIRGKPWFDTAAHPRARFAGTFARSANGLRLHGTLHLNGHSRQLTFPVALRRQGPHRVLLEGGLRLDRGDFAIGSGKWRNGNLIASGVAVRFSVVLAERD